MEERLNMHKQKKHFDKAVQTWVKLSPPLTVIKNESHYKGAKEEENLILANLYHVITH